MNRIAALAIVSSVLLGCGGRAGEAPPASVDGEPEQSAGMRGQEQEVKLPPYPKEDDLIEVSVGPTGSHRFFVDEKSLSASRNGVVRYTAVVRTSGGATNVAYEGLRCGARERRLYAVGSPQKRWMRARQSTWEPIRSGRSNEYQAEFYSQYFCPSGADVPDRETMLRSLKSGRSESDARGDHL
jgi:hypothetical protein